MSRYIPSWHELLFALPWLWLPMLYVLPLAAGTRWTLARLVPDWRNLVDFGVLAAALVGTALAIDDLRQTPRPGVPYLVVHVLAFTLSWALVVMMTRFPLPPDERQRESPAR